LDVRSRTASRPRQERWNSGGLVQSSWEARNVRLLHARSESLGFSKRACLRPSFLLTPRLNRTGVRRFPRPCLPTFRNKPIESKAQENSYDNHAKDRRISGVHGAGALRSEPTQVYPAFALCPATLDCRCCCLFNVEQSQNHLSGNACRLRRSTQHLPGVYLQGFGILRSF
jgi:hypothetical protein